MGGSGLDLRSDRTMMAVETHGSALTMETLSADNRGASSDALS